MSFRTSKKSIPGIDDSLLAVFRVIAVMLWRDGKIEPREEKWFRFLISRFEITTEQKHSLLADLKTCPDLNDVFTRIDNQYDRDRLLAWLRIAMNVDGKCTEIEATLYRKVLSLKDTSQDLAKDLLAAERELRAAEAHAKFWKRLGKIGRRLGRRTRYVLFFNFFRIP